MPLQSTFDLVRGTLVRTGFRLWRAAVLWWCGVAFAAPAALASPACLSGIDSATDAVQISATRALIEAACPCRAFDDSLGNKRADYLACVKKQIVDRGNGSPQPLRPECLTTVKQYYVRSVCGRDPRRHFTPCVETNQATGRVACSVVPTTTVNDVRLTTACADQPGVAQRSLCVNATSCIDAADTNHDLIIAAPGDSGACVPRPNFILINLDDTRFDGIDQMPTVQSRLVADGVEFQNSFVPLSLCCPSRASILCGLYAFHSGTRQLSGPIGGAHTFRESGVDHQTLPVWLQDAGYMTGLFGKYLNGYNDEQNKGPNGAFYVPPGWTRWRAFPVEHYGGQNGVDYELVDESGGVTPYHDHSTDAQYSTDVLAAELRQFIGDAVAAGQPFFAEWTPYASHNDVPNLQPLPAARHLTAFADLAPARPPNWAEADVSDKPRWIQSLNTTPLLYSLTDEARRNAYGTLLAVDEELALMLDQLAALGIADHTVILFTSDNGVAWGEHRWFGQGKECPYEECVRVPMIVYDPRRVGAARSAATPVLNIDVPATIADLAGVPIPVAIDGKSFRPALAGVDFPLRDDFLLEHWSSSRGATLTYRTQPRDGDRIRVFAGPFPKTSQVFEFDSDGVVGPGNVAVPIGASASATFGTLGTAITQHVPHTAIGIGTSTSQLSIADTSPARLGIYWIDDVNASASFTIVYPIPDFFGVRDVANNFTYVEHGSGEVELYDLTVDPWELDNKAGNPAYAVTQSRLAARTRELLELP
jgi:arylsulfatase A-like enzyme